MKTHSKNNISKKKLIIFLTDIDKDKHLLERAIFNSKFIDKKFFNFSTIKFNEDFCIFLNEIIDKSHLFPNRKGTNYQSLTYSLVNKWESNNNGLLEIISELTCRLTRGHYFINGNKRTAIISMNKFLNACGFSLRDLKKEDIRSWIYEEKWEKLFLDISDSSINEELAIDLLKERIWLDIKIYE